MKRIVNVWIDLEDLYTSEEAVPLTGTMVANLLELVNQENGQFYYARNRAPIIKAIDAGVPLYLKNGRLWGDVPETQEDKEKRLASKIKRAAKLQAELAEEGITL